MDWNDLKYVLAVSRAQSFQRAAATLKVSHTTVSRRITSIERDLSTSLFNRDSNGLQPTRACQALLGAAMRVETELQTIQHEVVERPEIPRGQVRIQSMPWIVNHILVPALADFTRAHPEVSLYLVGDLVDNPLYGNDPAILLRFEYQAKKNEADVKVASLGYSVYARRDSRPEELPWLTFHGGRLPTAPQSWIEAQTKDGNRIAILANDATIVHNSIRNGVGKGLIPEMLGANDPTLQCLSTSRPEIVRHLRAICDMRDLSNPALAATMKWIQATCAALKPEAGTQSSDRRDKPDLQSVPISGQDVADV